MADIDFRSAVIVPAPTAGGHAATKTYVDAQASAATSSALSTAAGLYDTLDSPVVAKTASYTLVDTDRVVIFNTASGAMTATLPTAVGRGGQKFVIKKLGGTTANPLTIDPNGSQTIDGALTEVISVAGGFREIISDNANWHIISGKVEPVVITVTSPANAGSTVIDASIGSIYRIATGVAGFILAAPTNPIDADSINIEITPTVTFALTINAAIINCTGVASPMAVPANKKLFLGLRSIGTTWYLLAYGIQP